MPSNTTYNPLNINDFEKTKLNANGVGITTTLTAGVSNNIDYVLTDDCLLTGVNPVISNGNYGDKLDMQVIDTTGAFSGIAGAVLGQYITSWYVPPTTSMQYDVQYPAKIYAGLTLRIIYHSSGIIAPFVAVNYKLHKTLI